ncbi:E3 ubiquitin-protein ligase RING1 [Rhynchospora pubera]|uniref:RING-type E3 ubiquitin transferase n=1 Tax=Rhynchospora pubera TaxID=906938 RepID=A0AAV8EKT2_9POAL|nr:E3 ubiquitin-protein ligase RING1 [Rhynchospora pubera]
MATMNSYWCYSCRRFVRISPSDPISCPHCSDGFLEEMSAPPPVNRPSGDILRRRRLPTAELRRHRRASAPSSDRSPFNPVIVLRRTRPDNTGTNSFELYYDDGAGSGLRPLPDSMSDFLMGSGFERLLDQLAQIEANGLGRAYENLPASKSAIESMPTLTISSQHVGMDSHCAVCKDPFELGAEAREMPCKHIYHQDCILPWLSIRNSCPVCRHEMPTDVTRRGSSGELTGEDAGNEDEMVGLTIWRLPGGGFAVGRFSGARRGSGSDRELPVVYTEVDGGFNNGGAPRRVSWASRGTRSRERSGFGRLLQRVFGCFGPNSSNSGADASPVSSSSSSLSSSSRNQRSSMLSRSSRRSMRWELESRDADSIAR